jgi:hypothetical protein
MRKKILMLSLLATLTASLCACGGSDSASSGTDLTQTSGNSANSDSDSDQASDNSVADTAYDTSQFSRVNISAGEKKELSTLCGITYPITMEEFDELSGGYKYGSDETYYEHLSDLVADTETPAEDDASKNSVSGKSITSISLDTLTRSSSLRVYNYSDDSMMIGQLIKENYFSYELYTASLIENVGDISAIEYIPSIIDNLGSPDYIIDYTTITSSTLEDGSKQDLCRYNMIYDYGSYVISLRVNESMTHSDGDNTQYDNVIGYTYFQRNAFLLYLDRDFADFSDDDLSVTSADGEISFSDFVQSEKDLVVDEASSDNTATRGGTVSKDSLELSDKVMSIDDRFTVSKWGYVLVGTVECDSIHVGDEVAVALSDGTYIQSTVSVMEINRKEIEEVEKDTLVGIVLDGVDADSGVDYNNVIYLLKK